MTARSRLAAFVVAALALSGCSNDSPPHWESVCVASHETTIFMPMVIGKSVMIMPMQEPVCDQYERRCMVGPDYKGLQTDCGPDDGR